MARSVVSTARMSKPSSQINPPVHRIGLLDLSTEIRRQIFAVLFSGYTVIDITETGCQSPQRTLGIQSILFVNRRFRREATELFFKVAEFKISHYLLHSKYRTYNPFGGLGYVRNLKIDWARPPTQEFTTIRAEPSFVLGLRRLEHVTIDCASVEPRRIPDERSTKDAIPKMITEILRQSPKWLRSIINNADRHFEVDLVLYFKKGTFRSAILDHYEHFEMVTFNWDSKEIKSITPYHNLLWRVRECTRRDSRKSRNREEEIEAQQRQQQVRGYISSAQEQASRGLDGLDGLGNW